MKQLIDRIAASFIGLLLLGLIEGLMTLGQAFNTEYNWIGYTLQGMLAFLAIWAANKAYEAETKGK